MLRGYEYCLNSDNPIMRDHKSKFFKRQAAVLQSMCGAMDRFAPNGVVRRRVRKIDQRYQELIGEPSAIQKVLSKSLEKRAKKFKIQNLLDPINRYPKEEPAKRYLYLKNKKLMEGDTPYKTQLLSKRPFDLKWNKFKFKQRSSFLSFISKLKPSKGDTGLDKHIIKGLKKQTIASAF
jgi:23S rRNA A1618 N6-methylase RlmF